jgi:hypothetical protein
MRQFVDIGYIYDFLFRRLEKREIQYDRQHQQRQGVTPYESCYNYKKTLELHQSNS